MLSISVEFLHGTFRGDPSGAANTGRLDRGEWPASPARLFAAFVAADGTGAACRVTDGAELEWFEQLPPPSIYADAAPPHQPLEPRFVVRQGGGVSKGTHQEYVGRATATNRAGVRVAPNAPRIVYAWDCDSPPDAILDALRRRAARVGYLGSADSPVRVRVVTELPRSAELAEAFVPDPVGDTLINVTQAGDLEHWDRLYRQWSVRGASASRSQYPALVHAARYRSPRAARVQDDGEVVAWLRLASAVSGRRIAALTALFKDAVLSQHQRIHGAPPAALHGHGFARTGYDIARYLALPDAGYARSRGLIHGLALWLPPGTESEVRRSARDAARSIRRLTGVGIDVAVAPHDDEPRPFAAHPDRWLQSSRSWSTAIPAIHERRRALDLEEVSRWCRHAGLPDPVAFRSERAPLIPGALELAPIEVNRSDRPPLPYSHIELRFNRPVSGPFAIGSGRQRGFGLCVPIHNGPDNQPHTEKQ
ncbi:MAG: type I-U CRISPR-associated protein Csb2 [Chloroflexi bacterium]|nr:type I-U CRISPR-associated protein Csb2 [Chloroflexota bacterium]